MNPDIKPLSDKDRSILKSWDPDSEIEKWSSEVANLGMKWETRHIWNDDRYRGKIHASSFNKSCDMFLYLERLGCKPQSRNGKKQKIYDAGTAVHLIMNYYQGTRAQHYGYESKPEVFIDTPIGDWLQVCGSTDEIVTGWPLTRSIVWDYKSINKRGLSKLTKPSKDYRRQLNTYMGCLGIPVGVICYYHKDSADTLSFIIEFDTIMWKEMQERAIMINNCADILTSPQRKVSSYCFMCAYFKDCEPPVGRRPRKSAPEV